MRPCDQRRCSDVGIKLIRYSLMVAERVSFAVESRSEHGLVWEGGLEHVSNGIMGMVR
jgi:hypothetical protein